MYPRFLHSVVSALALSSAVNASPVSNALAGALAQGGHANAVAVASSSGSGNAAAVAGASSSSSSGSKALAGASSGESGSASLAGASSGESGSASLAGASSGGSGSASLAGATSGESGSAALAGALSGSGSGSSSKDGFVRLDFNVFKGLDLGSALNNLLGQLQSLTARDGHYTNSTQSVSLSNQKSFYITELKIGSQQDDVKVLIDTGSSDLWVMSAENPYCKDNGGDIDCEQYGTYNETASSSFQTNESDFSISYLDNSFASGTWGQDTVTLNDNFHLENANFAVADKSNSDVGVFGISYKTAESADSPYDNLPIQMRDQGFIKKVAYSLYLTGAESEKGTILFGGIDNAKYTGELATIDIKKQSGDLVYLQVPLTSISVNITSNDTSAANNSDSPSKASIVDWLNGLDSNGDSNEGAASGDQHTTIDTNNIPAILDSGTTLTFLQDDYVKQIVKQLQPGGARFDSSYGGYVVSCSLRQEGNSITYRFNDEKDIVVPLSDAILNAGTDSSTGQQVCMLGVVPSDQVILGDNFLRSAYTVFNLEDGVIELAQMKYTDSEDISVIS